MLKRYSTSSRLKYPVSASLNAPASLARSMSLQRRPRRKSTTKPWQKSTQSVKQPHRDLQRRSLPRVNQPPRNHCNPKVPQPSPRNPLPPSSPILNPPPTLLNRRSNPPPPPVSLASHSPTSPLARKPHRPPTLPPCVTPPRPSLQKLQSVAQQAAPPPLHTAKMLAPPR